MSENENYCGNYDLLRIICCVSVIILHVSGVLKYAITDDDLLWCDIDVKTTIVFNTFVRFAVPCFMMISGAFLISDKNKDYKAFYSKVFRKNGIVTFCFSFYYFLLSLIKLSFLIPTKGMEYIADNNPFMDWFTGAPYYHMWYMYTLLGVYMFIPLVVRLKNDISESAFSKVTWIFMAFSVLSEWTSSFKIEWGVSKVIGYVAFVMVGYEIKRLYFGKNNLKKAILFIIGGLLLEGISSAVQYNHTIGGISEVEEEYSVIGNFNPLIALASILIFTGFSLLNIKSMRFYKLARITLYIYLFHAGILELLYYILKKTQFIKESRLIILIFTVVVFIVSLVLSIAYIKIWNKFERKTDFTNLICKKAGLQ